MKRFDSAPLIACLALVVALIALPRTSLADSQIGGGVHYWRTIDDIDVHNVDEDGLAWLVSYRFSSESLFKVHAEVEFLPDDFGGSPDQVMAPQVYLLGGGGLYAGVGIGIYYADGDFANDPFYAFRAGVEIALMGGVRLDLNANYRFDNIEDISAAVDNVDTDTVTIGAAIRIDI
ncbi:MAG: hypothetical protein O2923_10280 [Verrucomicrobia bacterium]|nr:hypothetical protein [Verrucomicrobiota bacterium]